jgi:hypothetical protein
LDGRLSIDCFVDTGRAVLENGYQDDSAYDTPDDFVQNIIDALGNVPDTYSEIALPYWYKQKHYVEIWLEKNAMASTFESYLSGDHYNVRIIPNRGYSGLGFLHANSERLQRISKEEPNKRIHIRYFGDYDPSGDDMDRDIQKRLGLLGIHNADFKRVAIKPEHIQKYNLPPVPSDEETINKLKRDPRRAKFVAKNGGLEIAVELDALAVYAPEDFKKMVQGVVDEFYDKELREKQLKEGSSDEFKANIKKIICAKLKELKAKLGCYDNDDQRSNRFSDAAAEFVNAYLKATLGVFGFLLGPSLPLQWPMQEYYDGEEDG